MCFRFKGMPESEVLLRLLPDRLEPDLDIVIVGINPGLYAAFVSSELETRHRERIAASLQVVTDVDGPMPKIKAVAMEFGVFVSMEGGEYMVVSCHPRPL